VTTPTTRAGNVWSWVDLEIDLHRYIDGRVEIEDEDEFEDSVAKGYISESEQAEALRITPVLEQMLRDHTEPFGAVGARRLAEAIGLGLPPL
jgi:predicted RNA-binding protein associated with RNAse of E/G family